MNKVLEIIKTFNDTAKVIIAVLVVLLVTQSVNSCGRKTEIEEYNRRFETYSDSVTKVLQTNDSIAKVMKLRADSLQQDSIKAARQTREINRLRNSLESSQGEKTRLKEEIDSLRRLTPDTSEISLKKDTIIALLREDSAKTHTLVNALEQRDLTRLQTIATITADRDGAVIRAINAEERLINLPKPPSDPDKWFFDLLPKPSRTTAAVGGVIIGFIGGILVFGK